MSPEKLVETINLFLEKGASWKYLESRVKSTQSLYNIREFYRLKNSYQKREQNG